jgi:hypothetical protein
MSTTESQLAAMWRDVYRRMERQTSPTLANLSTINFIIDGGGSAVTTGIKGYLVVDFACRITGVDLLADRSGSAVVDVLRSTYATFPTFTSLTASATPALTAAQKYQDSTLTGWTLAISPGDILEFNVVSAATVQLLLVGLRVRRG